MSDPELDAVVGQLWMRLAPSMRADAARLLALTVAIDEPGAIEVVGSDGVGPDDIDARWIEVCHLAHRLAGSLGSLGQHAAGREAVALEDLTSGRDAPDPSSRPWLRAHAYALVAHLGTR